MKNYREKLKDIHTIIFDYDGVMTDGYVMVLPDGEALRRTNVKDGYALQLAIKKGIRLAVISGGRGKNMEKRLEMVKIEDVYLGVDNKIKVFRAFLEKHKLKAKDVIYVGDDIPDYEVMKEAGLAMCPEDAAEEIKSICHYISHAKGGQGVVRDVIEQVLKAHGLWMNEDAYHW